MLGKTLKTSMPEFSDRQELKNLQDPKPSLFKVRIGEGDPWEWKTVQGFPQGNKVGNNCYKE